MSLPTHPTDLPLFLTIGDITGLLGISRRTVRRWIARGQLLAYRTGPVRGRVRISREALLTFLETRRA